MNRDGLVRWLIGVGLFIGALVVYVATLTPSIAGGDSGDMVVAAYTLGVPHPPGYPLYTLLGKAFTLLPVGDAAYRVNLSSAVYGAAAVAMVYALLLDLTGRRLPASVGAGALAFSPLFWSYSLFAEVFALNNLFAAALLFLALRWRKQPRSRVLPLTLAFATGLALSHHQMIVLLAPAVIYLAWAPLRKTQPRYLALMVLMFILGLLPYAYLPITGTRETASRWEPPTTFAEFVRFVARSDYGSGSLVAPEGQGGAPRIVQAGIYAGSLLKQFTPVGVVLGLLGLWRLYRRAHPLFAALLSSFLLTGVGFGVYANVTPDGGGAISLIQKFYTMSFVVFAVFLGLGTHEFLGLVKRWLGNQARLAAVAPLLLPIFLLLSNYTEVDSHESWLGRRIGEDMLASMRANGLITVYADDGLFILDYLQRVENLRPDVVVPRLGLMGRPWYDRGLARLQPPVTIPPGQPYFNPDWQNRFIQANLGTRPIYVFGVAVEPGKGLTVVPRGVVLEVVPTSEVDLAVIEPENEALWTRYESRSDFKPYPAYSWRLDIMQGYALAPFALGLRYLEAGRPDDAERLYQRSVRMSPDFPPPYANLGEIYWIYRGQPEEGLKYLKRFLALRPYTEPAQQVRQDVQQLEDEIGGISD